MGPSKPPRMGSSLPYAAYKQLWNATHIAHTREEIYREPFSGKKVLDGVTHRSTGRLEEHMPNKSSRHEDPQVRDIHRGWIAKCSNAVA